MVESRQYDTVAFDVRDNATMLFFAKTTDEGDISDYLLLMRTVDEEFSESIYIEINEQQFGGHNLIREAALTSNVLTLRLFITVFWKMMTQTGIHRIFSQCF
jgi:hypothetical protein